MTMGSPVWGKQSGQWRKSAVVFSLPLPSSSGSVTGLKSVEDVCSTKGNEQKTNKEAYALK